MATKHVVKKGAAAAKTVASKGNKTQPTKQSVAEFLAGVGDPDQQADAKKLVALLKRATGEKAEMWGSSIVGFGRYHYVYESGREGDSMLAGFSPRKGQTVLYGMSHEGRGAELMARFGKHKTGVGCLYVKRLADVDLDVLSELIQVSVASMRAKYPG